MGDVCHIVNAVSDTSAPADIATSLVKYTDINEVAVVSWFRSAPFEGDDLVTTHTLKAPRNVAGVDRNSLSSLRSILAEYDLVHTHHNHSGFYGKLVGRRLGKPVVTTEHNNHDGYSRKGRIANGISNPMADVVTCVSDAVRDSFSTWELVLLADREVRVVTNGVDINRLRASHAVDWTLSDHAEIATDSIVIGTAGMLTWQKGQDTLIRAIAEVNQASTWAMDLVVAGDGALDDDLRSLCRDLEIEEHVHFLGYLEKREFVYQMMRQVDVYAMPSRWEGFCVAALEAMAAGTPCVFSDIDEFERPFDEVARFHPVEDHHALASCLVELADDPDGRANLGARARAFVEDRHSLERTARSYADIYREFVG